MRKVKHFTFLLLVLSCLSSCSVYNKSMREPNVRVELNKNDFELSNQLSAEATSVTVFGINWKRLKNEEIGTVNRVANGISINNVFPNIISNIPVIGGIVNNKTSNYALYVLMAKNLGYDVVFYPQFESEVKKPFLGIGFIYTKTWVKVRARLGKLKK